MVVVKTSQYQKITKELYKKNLELVNANNILALLRQLYEIMIASSNMREVSQRFIDIVTETLKFPSGLVAIERLGKQLEVIAVTPSAVNKEALKLIDSSLPMKVSLKEKENILVEAFLAEKKRTTHNILEVWKPLITGDNLKDVAKKTNIESTLAYPIIFGKEPLGIFSVSLGRDAEDMTRFEKMALRRVVTLFGIAIDRVRISQNLRKTNKRLKEVSALKDEFVYLASHELRTPLTAISGSLSTINDGYVGKVGKEAQEFIQGAYNESQRLIRLVNNLLNISRIEGGRLKFDLKKFDLAPIIFEAGEALKTQAIEKKIDLVFDSEKKLNINADEDKIREILVNLIGNAIKFTDKGGVKISSSKQGALVVVAVEDTGHGINPQDKDKLFKKFGRLDSTKEQKKGGTGLGLYISKTLIEGMSGQIWLKSEYGKGSTFFFTLPLS